MPPAPLTDSIERLRTHYGSPDPPPSDDPLELILWKQIAYLASDAQRAVTFELLVLRLGLVEWSRIEGHEILLAESPNLDEKAYSKQAYKNAPQV